MSARGRCFRLVLAGILALGAGPAQAQDAVSAAADQSSEHAVAELDIRTSTLLELADWCRRLGLAESGTAPELAARLRAHYGIAPAGSSAGGTPAQGGPRSIIIEAARSSEYFTLQTVDEDYARLSGNVSIRIQDGETAHRLKAREIVYNRTRNSLSAEGAVEYVKESGGTVETFRGETLTLQLDSWAGVFIAGVSERSLAGEQTTYRFAGDLISRTEDEVTILSRARISNAGSDEAYWSIDASKLWLLPGSEWAIFNGVLKVGEIPLLYIPFLYLPGDELIFHPVLGYRSREGSFLQTTTYLLGRPKAAAASENSITKILGSGENTERVREGLFLRSTGKLLTDADAPRWSLLFDAYANLGAYLGTEVYLPKNGIFGKTDFSAGLGLTRNVYLVGGDYYTPFAQFDGVSEWNETRLFSRTLPFRYRLKATGSLTGSAGSLTWSLPFYADPYVDQDFLNRSENMDWFEMIKQGAAVEEDAAAIGVLGAYEWRFGGSLNPKVESLKPAVSALTLTSAASALSFKTRTSTDLSGTTSPDRTFFYPDKFTLISAIGSVTGTPLSLGAPPATAPGGAADQAGTPIADPLAGIGVPVSPWPERETERSVASADPAPPALAQSFALPSTDRDFRLVLDYRLTPSVASELQFRSSAAHWPEASDIAWDDYSSILTTLKSEATTSLTFSDSQGYLTALLHAGGTGAWQDYSYLNEEAEEYDSPAEKDAALLRAYNSTLFTSNAEFSLTAKPFVGDEVWGGSNLKYTLKGLLAKTAFDGSALEPSWELVYGTWTPEDLETHSLAATMAASIRGREQSLFLVSDLPPEEGKLSAGSTLRVWRTQSTVGAAVLDPFGTPYYNPVTFSETLDLGEKRTLKQEGVYDPELEELTSLVSSLAFGKLSASFQAAYSYAYEMEADYGWKTSADPQRLLPKKISLAYNDAQARDPLWLDRIAYTLNLATSLDLDLQRYTYSTFSFSLGTTVKIAEFMDLTLSAKSQNAVLYRYLQDLPIWQENVAVPGEQNILVDLADSFRFDDEEKRQSSGFKLKSFSFGATHYLGDWNAKLGIDLAPYLDTTQVPYRYLFNTKVSFLVQWIPIPELKTQITRDKDAFVYY